MHEMKFSLPGTEAVTLTGQEIDKLIRAGDGDAALLYLYIRKTGGQRSDTGAAKELDKSKGWVASASAVLSRLGLIQINMSGSSDLGESGASGQDSDVGDNKGVPNEPRQYTAKEVTQEIANDNNFSQIVDETQRKLGKILSEDELVRLFGIYDYLRMPPEVIFQLLTHCISECRKAGGGRAPSMRYIEKAAFTWEREGVLTLERAEDYLKALEVRKEVRSRIKRILQISGRELSETEKKYVDGWVDLKVEPDAIAIAYDKTVVKTGAMTWPYIDKIIKNWHSKGLLTAKQVSEMEGKQQGSSSKSNSRANSRQGAKLDRKRHGEPNREEIERMQRILEKMKKGDKENGT